MTSAEYTLEGLLEVALEAAKAGSRVLADRAGETLDVSTKGQAGDIVTNIDLESERLVRRAIIARRPLDEISGEELEHHENPSARVRWSVDPLDGTTNFARRAPYYCTSVAAQDLTTGHWLVGAVVAPALGRTYFASRGAGAWLTTAQGTSRLLGPTGENSSRLLGLGFSYDPDSRDRQFAAIPRLMTAFSDIRSLGSAALGLCEVADGRLDAFFESDLFEFDWAAGALIAEEAGVTVIRPPGLRGGVATAPFDENDVSSARI